MSFSNRRILSNLAFLVTLMCVGADVFTTVLSTVAFTRFLEKHDKILLFSSKKDCLPCKGFHVVWGAMEKVLSQIDEFKDLKLGMLYLKDGDTLQQQHWSLIEEFPSVHFLEFGESYKYRGELDVEPIIGFLQEMMSDAFMTINEESELVTVVSRLPDYIYN